MFGFLVYCIYQRGARTDFDSNVLDTNCNCSIFDLSTRSESLFYLVHCSTHLRIFQLMTYQSSMASSPYPGGQHKDRCFSIH